MNEMKLGGGDNMYDIFGTPEAITLKNGDIVRPGDRVFHTDYGYGTITSFGAAGSSIYNLDVRFDNWDRTNSPPYRALPGRFDISLWGSQEPRISKVVGDVY